MDMETKAMEEEQSSEEGAMETKLFLHTCVNFEESMYI